MTGTAGLALVGVVILAIVLAFVADGWQRRRRR
jgi:type II secretory pathway pseudopilin PulG